MGTVDAKTVERHLQSAQGRLTESHLRLVSWTVNDDSDYEQRLDTYKTDLARFQGLLKLAEDAGLR